MYNNNTVSKESEQLMRVILYVRHCVEASLYYLIDFILTGVVSMRQVLLLLQLQRRKLRLSEVTWLGQGRMASACDAMSQPRLSALGAMPLFASIVCRAFLALGKPPSLQISALLSDLPS